VTQRLSLEQADIRNPRVSAYWSRFAANLAVFDEITTEHCLVADAIKQELSQSCLYLPVGPRNILDIGPGYGRLARLVHLVCDSRLAVEPNPHLAATIEPLYNKVTLHKWESLNIFASSFAIILASQVLYYFPSKVRARCIRTMIDHLAPGGSLFISVDGFEGEFGRFVLEWSQILGIADHIVLPDLVRDVLSDCADIEAKETQLHAVLQSDSLQRFAEGVSIYFDVHPDTLVSAPTEYRSALRGFAKGSEFVARNAVTLWSIRKRA
jgi:SAM-dependent methyltransferase